MSIRDRKKIVIVSSALTGEVIIEMQFDDFITQYGRNYLNMKINELIDEEQGVIIKLGCKP